LPADDDTLIPLAQAALRLGITKAVAYSRVRQGKLHARLSKNRLMVLPSEVDRYREDVISHRTHGTQRGGKQKSAASHTSKGDPEAAGNK